MRRSGWERLLIGGVAAAALAGIAWVGVAEMRSSWLQAGLLSKYAREMVFEVAAGRSGQIAFPAQGPYNERLGYAEIPEFVDRLSAGPYVVERQARMSDAMTGFVEKGGFAIYREKTSAGITIRDRNGQAIYAARFPERVFEDFEAIPKLVVDTLLFIENRELLRASAPTHNPAVEWDRFAYAALGLPAQWLNPDIRVPGGSTLATQIEKYRHSRAGQTADARDKLRQMVSASVRAYLDGMDTSFARRRIVVDYLNSTPLTARIGFGEVNGLGDGLWAWFGTDLDEATRILRTQPRDRNESMVRATIYKQVLSLLLAQRRPSRYLLADRRGLEDLADSHLRLLAQHAVIDADLRDAALRAELRFRTDTPRPPGTSFVEQKAANAIRTRLLGLLGVNSLYRLDRIDLTAETSLDAPMQDEVVRVLERLGDPAFVEAFGLTGSRLLDTGGTGTDAVTYSVVLYERGEHANHVRIQADNLDQPLDINEGAKLDLGSTAKLRTLITYLEIVEDLYERYAHLPRTQLRSVADEGDDPLTRWVAGRLAETADIALADLLEAAMQRRYSASPAERFFTGGGVHTFVNFDAKDNGSVPTVTEAIRHSINLPFIRMMREIVQFHVAEGMGEDGDILRDPDNPARRDYLKRFADKEGSVFLNRFYTDYRGRSPDEALDLLASRVRPAAPRLAVVFRSVRPDAPFAEFAHFMRSRLPGSNLGERELRKLFERYGIDRLNLADRGYVARRHPLELWLVNHMQAQPDATRSQVLAASAPERQETYAWLFRTSRKNAQDSRIRTLLEEDAFKHIHATWARLGYPFGSLVPSYATSIGSSADRPGALADLMGIIMNDGIKLPTVRVERLHFAMGTPYETVMGYRGRPGERVLSAEISATVRRALIDIAENGTVRRLKGAFPAPDGKALPVGGKTGTGDHRYGDRVVARTATLVFFIGDRFFGTLTAHVHGPDAARFRFTSALPAQLLKGLAPTLQPLIDRPAAQPVMQTVETREPAPGDRPDRH
ncbi:MAG TPA: transglycosylase domain-containing protein [Arenibaculum sp.]|nr:transglycosylase domain-containing protein [Arenibaculum sp.]